MSAVDFAGAERASAAGHGVRRWIAHAGIAVADQALSSGASLVLAVLLARFLPVEEFGAFAIGMLVLLLVSTVHNALVLEPMSVLGPGRYAGTLPAYLRPQTTITLAVALPLATLLAAAGMVMTLVRSAAGPALIGAGAAAPFVFMQWTARRRAYIEGRPAGALKGSATLIGCAAIAAASFAGAGWRSSLSGFAALAIASAVSTWVMRTSAQADPAFPWRTLLREQWGYGRWFVGTSIITVAGMQAHLTLTALVLGLGAAGRLRAMHVLILPMSHAITAISTVALPSMAQDIGAGAVGRARRTGRGVGAVLVASAVVYELVLIVGSRTAERVLYGGKYAAVASLIPVLGLVPLMEALAVGPCLEMRAARRPADYLRTGVATAVVGIAAGAVLPQMLGIAGAAWSLVAAYAASALTAATLARRRNRREGSC